MIRFTDPVAALGEAQFLADTTGWPHCIVDTDDGVMEIIVKHRSHDLVILETVHPME